MAWHETHVASLVESEVLARAERSSLSVMKTIAMSSCMPYRMRSKQVGKG